MPTPSKKYQLNSEDLTKLATSAIIAGVAAFGLFVANSLPHIDFSVLGQWAAPVGALATFGVNFLRKWVSSGSTRPRY